MGKRVIDLEDKDLESSMKKVMEEFKEYFQPVLEKYSDVHLEKKELAELWNIDYQSVARYVRDRGLPELKNGKISLKEACEWLYSDRWVQQTAAGKDLFNKIKEKYSKQ